MVQYLNKPVSFEDIIFEHRNKAYGAYLLRKFYGRTVIFSLFISLTIFTIALMIPLLQSLMTEKIPQNLPPKNNFTDLVFINLNEQEKQKNTSLNESRNFSEKSVSHTLKKDLPPEIVDDSKAQRVTSENNIEYLDSVDIKGPEVSGEHSLSNDNSSNSFDNKGLKYNNIDMRSPELSAILPSFPGGLTNYVNSNLTDRLLSYLQVNKIKGNMFVTMVIARDGSVVDVQLSKGLKDCKTCDEEIPEIIKRMPKWEPAIMNGYPVKVRIVVPIEF